MSPDQREFLNLIHLPAVLTREQAGWVLGYTPVEIDILRSAGVIAALGRPKRNSRKVYMREEIMKLQQDKRLLDRAQVAISNYWERKNASRRLETNELTESEN